MPGGGDFVDEEPPAVPGGGGLREEEPPRPSPSPSPSPKPSPSPSPEPVREPEPRPEPRPLPRPLPSPEPSPPSEPLAPQPRPQEPQAPQPRPQEPLTPQGRDQPSQEIPLPVVQQSPGTEAPFVPPPEVTSITRRLPPPQAAAPVQAPTQGTVGVQTVLIAGSWCPLGVKPKNLGGCSGEAMLCKSSSCTANGLGPSIACVAAGRGGAGASSPAWGGGWGAISTASSPGRACSRGRADGG